MIGWCYDQEMNQEYICEKFVPRAIKVLFYDSIKIALELVVSFIDTI